MPLINVSPPRFSKYGPDALARTVAYLYSKLPKETSILIRDGKIFLDMPIDRLDGRQLGEAWRAELAALADHPAEPCPCGCGSDLVFGECVAKETAIFLTTEEACSVWEFAENRYQGRESGQGALLIDVVKKVRMRTGLTLSGAHQRVMETAERMIETFKAAIPGGLTIDEYKFIERSVGTQILDLAQGVMRSDSPELELTKLAIDVGQRIGLAKAFANVYAYAEFVKRTI